MLFMQGKANRSTAIEWDFGLAAGLDRGGRPFGFYNTEAMKGRVDRLIR